MHFNGLPDVLVKFILIKYSSLHLIKKDLSWDLLSLLRFLVLSAAQVQSAELDTASDGEEVERLGDVPDAFIASPFPNMATNPMPTTSFYTGEDVTITGRGMWDVTKACVRTVCNPVTVKSSGRQVTFKAPGERPGILRFYDANGKSWQVGLLTVGPKPLASVDIGDVELIQMHAKGVKANPLSDYLSWTAQRPMLVRAVVLSNKSTTTATVKVQATYASGNVSNQLYTMTGPANVPQRRPSENDLSNTWTVTLPADKVKPGMSLTFTAQAPDGTVKTWTYAPSVTSPTYARIVVVPLTAVESGYANVTASIDIDAYKKHMRSVIPVSVLDIVQDSPLAVRDPASSNDFYTALRNYRTAKGAANYEFYQGIIPWPSAEGLGSRPGRASVAAVTWGGSHAAAIRVPMTHELGHNFGRRHAWEDPNFPYYQERIGEDWLVNLQTGNTFYDPFRRFDVMSFESNSNMSPYTYNGMKEYATANLPSSPLPAYSGSGSVISQLDGNSTSHAFNAMNDEITESIVYSDRKPMFALSGSYSRSGLSQFSVLYTQTKATNPAPDSRKVEVTVTWGNGQKEKYVTAPDDFSDTNGSFIINVPAKGRMEHVNVAINGQSIGDVLAATSRPQGDFSSVAYLSDGRVEIKPYPNRCVNVTVVHRYGDNRDVLALQTTSSIISVPASVKAKGGSLEAQCYDGRLGVEVTDYPL